MAVKEGRALASNHRVYDPITKLVSFTPKKSRLKFNRPLIIMYTRRRRTVYNLIFFLASFSVGLIMFSSRPSDKCNHFKQPYLETIIPEVTAKSSGHEDSRSLLFVGVMTAKRYLSTRATAVYETWGKDIPGKIEFFSSERSTPPSNKLDLPLVPLLGVDDSYPPQKKSFLMMQYMWENYGDKFEWFLRADDDVYIRADKMETFLRSIDSNKPLFIGQAGRGNQEEFGLLSLEYDENFCMGGPGIIMSRETLARVAPHVKYCLKNLYTNHEDVELGRCVQRFAGIPCTWSYEMQTIFYHNSSGNEAFNGNLKQKEIHRAITLHPVKKFKNLYRIHNYMTMLHVREYKQDIVGVQREILGMANLLNNTTPLISTFDQEELESSRLFGQNPGLSKSQINNVRELIQWDFIQRSLYSSFNANPRRKIDASLKEGLEDVIREVMEMINMFSKQRGRIIDFKDLLYGYHRINPLFGADYILDMLLVFKKYRGRKMTVPVRRHAYLQQQFTDISIREVFEGIEVHQDIDENEDQLEDSIRNAQGIKEVLEIGLLKLSENLPSIIFQSTEYETSLKKPINDKTINFILPLSGRFDVFKRFIKTFEEVCLKNNEKVALIVVLFPNDKENTVQEILDTIKGLQKQYSYTRITAVPVFDNFSRANALSIGASQVNAPLDLLFFIDVDIVFRSGCLQRIRTNTIRGKSVYFPIVYSEFDPEVVYNKAISPSHFNINEETGYWRQYGFGIGSVYKSDLLKVGGFNTSITGWGKEDVDLFDKFIAASANITIFRAADPDLVHVFHIVDCDPNLEATQLGMCKATRADTYGSVKQLSEYFKINRLKINTVVSL